MASLPERLRREYESIQKELNDGSTRRNANRTISQENARRVQAGRNDHLRKQPTFLRPQDIQEGIDYNFEKVYLTTLGDGQLRILTPDDLRAFKKNIDLLQNQYKKGITPKQVINLSLPSDVERSNKQIHLVIPQSVKDGVVHFITNASNDSAQDYHHINVEFLAYRSLALKPTEVTQNDVKQNLSFGKVKFECTCGRHTYWYRYMATLGGYGYGRPEEGFPKIRNPNLAGAACKHVLRVMNYILSTSGQLRLYNFIKRDRSSQYGQRRKVTTKQANDLLNAQLAVSEKGKTPQIKQNLNARNRELQRRVNNLNKQYQKQTQQNYMKQYRIDEKEAQERIKKNAMSRLDTLLASGVITQAEYNLYRKGTK